MIFNLFVGLKSRSGINTYADAMKAYFGNHQKEAVAVKLEGRITVDGEGE